MSDQDLHQVTLRWPHTDANEVIVAGTFDQWSSSLRLTRKPDGFEAPVFIPWREKIAYKFIVDGRWVTNDSEPTEIDHGFVNNVYTAPPKPEPQQITAPPSYHSEPEVEPQHAEKVPEHADKAGANGSALLDESHEAATQDGAVITPAAEASQAAPSPQDVERVSDEAPKEPVPAAVASPAQSDLEERSTYVPVHVAAVAPAALVVDQVEEPTSGPVSTSAPEPVPEGTRDADAGAEGLVEVEKVSSPTLEVEPPKESTLDLDDKAKTAAAPESAPQPEPGLAAPVEPVPEPAKVEEGAPAAEVLPDPGHETAVPEPPKPTTAIEQAAETTGPVPPVEPVAAAPEPKPDVPSSPLPSAREANGHTKSMSTASGSTASPTLPTGPTRKTSRKFSFPGWDKSGSSSPTGSSRFSSQQKREKRHSFLGKLKEIFGDKDKKEKEKEKSGRA